MIGLPIGLYPIGFFHLSQQVIAVPNIILNGTLDFGYTFPQPSLANNLLNFPIITSDDNTIQVNLNNSLNAQQITPSSVAVSVFAPNTTTPAIITPTPFIFTGGFQFSLPNDDVADLISGEYPWIARVILSDGTRHTVTCGDQNQTTGVITVLERP